jgi:cytochrome P450
MEGKSTSSAEAAKSFAGTTLDPSQGPAAADMPWLISYHDVDEAFRSKDFVQGGGGRRDSAPFTGHGVLSLSGDDHFARRRVESGLFRKSVLGFYERDVLAPALAAGFAACAARRSADGLVRAELQTLLRSALCKVSAALSGLDGVDTPETTERLLLYMDKLSAGANIEWASRDHREIIQESLGFKRLFVDEFFAPSWQRREALVASVQAGTIGEDALPNDLLTVMARNRTHFAKWDEDVFVRELILFNGAPTNTITLAAPHVIMELWEWCRLHPDDRDKTADVDFLRQAINEALRLHPASPYLIRRTVRDVTLPSGTVLAAGQYVVLDLVRASRDPTVFAPNPEAFDPYRQPREKLRPTWLAFGGGPHTCIGMSMAIGEASAGPNDPDAPLGLLVFLLKELYAAGIGLDPAHPPRWNDANVRNEYAEFPVVFRRI